MDSRLLNPPKCSFFLFGPRGPPDSPEEIRGPALETLFLQHLRAGHSVCLTPPPAAVARC